MTERSLRFGIIGYGYTGHQHFRAIQSIESASVGRVAELDAHKRAEATAPAFSDYRALLRDDSIDAVTVCLPHHLHEEVAMAALEAGKHLLVEKPLCLTSAAGERVCEAARTAGKTLMVEMTHRFFPTLIEARHLIQSGAIGEILAIDDILVEDFGVLGSLPAWMLRRDQAGGGFGLTSGIHLLDHVAWLVNQSLTLDTARFTQSQGLGDVEDTASLSLHLDNGAPVHILVCLRANGSGLEGNINIYGSKGTLRVGPWSGWTLESEGRIESKTYFRPEVPVTARALVGITGAMREFVDAVRKEREPEPAPETSLISQRLIEQAYSLAGLGQA